MKKVITAWKPLGLSPLQLINKIKLKYPEYENEKISYAGRLDPLAEGILLLLVNEENRKRDKYLKLKKKYISEIIIGISTDSYDQLGVVNNVNLEKIDKKIIIKELLKNLGKSFQHYPAFSSKAISGKPLFWWTRNNKLREIELPGKEIEIYKIKVNEVTNISGEKIAGRAIKNVENVNGDFRQGEIIECWKLFLEKYRDAEFAKLEVEIDCSSGTYIRSIANDLGKKLKTGAFAYSITRKKIGNFNEDEAINI